MRCWPPRATPRTPGARPRASRHETSCVNPRRRVGVGARGGGRGRRAVGPATAPDDAGPGAPDGADRALVVVAAGAGASVEVAGPGSGGGWSRRGWRARRGGACRRPSGRRPLAPAGLDRDGGHAAVGGERVAAGVARAAVADLGEQPGGRDHRAGVAKQRQEDLAVSVAADGAGDLALELADALDQRAQRGGQREHDPAPGFALEFAGAALGRAAQAGHQLDRLRAARVGVAGQERLQALGAEAAGVGGAGVALEERERDRRVDLGEQTGRAGPEALQLGAQLVGQRDARLDQVLAGARERPDRLGLVASGTSARKRCASVRASSQSTKASKRSDLPPAARKRALAALTWLGCRANTVRPASSSRSTSSPSGRSIATRSTPWSSKRRQSAAMPCSSWAITRSASGSPRSSATSSACSSLGPVRLQRTLPWAVLLGRVLSDERPTGRYRCGCSLTGALRRHVLWPLQVPPTAGRRRSHAGPQRGKRSRRSPGGGQPRREPTGRAKERMTSERRDRARRARGRPRRRLRRPARARRGRLRRRARGVRVRARSQRRRQDHALPRPPRRARAGAGRVHVAGRPAYVAQTERTRLDFPVTALDVALMGGLARGRWWLPPRRAERAAGAAALERVGP